MCNFASVVPEIRCATVFHLNPAFPWRFWHFSSAMLYIISSKTAFWQHRNQFTELKIISRLFIKLSFCYVLAEISFIKIWKMSNSRSRRSEREVHTRETYLDDTKKRLLFALEPKRKIIYYSSIQKRKKKKRVKDS